MFQEVPALKAAFRAPLVEMKGSPWVKDSADFITIVEEDGLEFEITEIKTRTSVRSAGQEYDRVNRVNATRHKTIDFDSPFLRDYIESCAEAMQLLHHALTYKSKYVRHIVGTAHGQIISSVRIRFSNEVLEEYNTCLQELKDLLLPWAYSDQNERIPQDVLQLAETSLKDVVGGRFGLVQQFNMWKELLKPERLPLPPLRLIIPTIHANWNIKKTASDTITKMIDGSCNGIIPPVVYINANTLVTARTINYALVTCHRLRQLWSCNVENHESLREFRNAANKRMSYKNTIQAAVRFFNNMATNEAADGAPCTEQIIQRIRRVRIQGELISDKMILDRPVTGKTPKKNAKARYYNEDVNIPQEILDRRKNCRGPVVYLVPQKGGEILHGKKCFVCSSVTNWWCVGCHHYFCMGAKKGGKISNRQLKYSFIEGEKPEEIMCTQLFCWHQEHPALFIRGDAPLP